MMGWSPDGWLVEEFNKKSTLSNEFVLNEGQTNYN